MDSKLKSLTAEVLRIDESKINSNSDIVNDLGADSLDVVELIMRVEDDYDIEVSDEDAEKIKTIGDIEEYLKDVE